MIREEKCRVGDHPEYYSFYIHRKQPEIEIDYQVSMLMPYCQRFSR